ncbi:tektin-B1 [Halyomorpha halys]|uniref:tektin-B1 n=1 Tax=Halyomorpha halys TaxID=286706 RepID=UPI0006D4F501|nr:tektin-B1 [Halyomorpha halys]
MQSIITLEKPLTRVALPDWHGKVWELRQTCDTRRKDASDLKNASKEMRNDTDCTTRWDTYINNNRLQDRVVEISKWAEIFKNKISAIDREVALMTKEKDLTETEIEFLGLSFTVTNECLTQRDQRGGADLCTDDAEIEIKHELSMLESLKVMLKQRCMAAWEQTNRLEELKSQLSQDLEDKIESLEMDTYLLGIDKNCGNISYKPDALRIPNEMLSYEAWLEHCTYLNLKAETELKSSFKLRESMYIPRERARMDLEAQNDATNFALRKRIYETQRIKNELDWQRLNMVQDMEKLHKEIDAVEKAHLNKTNALKLAESRLENRLHKGGAECCRDEAAFGLENEVTQLRATRANLKNMMNRVKATFNALEEQLVVIDRELHNKNHALNTDLRCLDLRARLKTGDRAGPNTQMDRNIELTKMKDEIPPE